MLLFEHRLSIYLTKLLSGNSVHLDAAIPTNMGGYLRNKQSKSTIIFFYENRQEENQEDQLESCA